MLTYSNWIGILLLVAWFNGILKKKQGKWVVEINYADLIKWMSDIKIIDDTLFKLYKSNNYHIDIDVFQNNLTATYGLFKENSNVRLELELLKNNGRINIVPKNIEKLF